MTDNEIIKALECCLNADSVLECYECVYHGKEHCLNSMIIDVLDLINRQKADIKRLTSGKCIYLSDDETTEYCVEGPCPKYKTEEQIKTEAVKECIEKIKSRSSKAVMTEHGIPVAGSASYSISEVELYKIVKEMVGENNAPCN